MHKLTAAHREQLKSAGVPEDVCDKIDAHLASGVGAAHSTGAAHAFNVGGLVKLIADIAAKNWAALPGDIAGLFS